MTHNDSWLLLSLYKIILYTVINSNVHYLPQYCDSSCAIIRPTSIKDIFWADDRYVSLIHTGLSINIENGILHQKQ